MTVHRGERVSILAPLLVILSGIVLGLLTGLWPAYAVFAVGAVLAAAALMRDHLNVVRLMILVSVIEVIPYSELANGAGIDQVRRVNSVVMMCLIGMVLVRRLRRGTQYGTTRLQTGALITAVCIYCWLLISALLASDPMLALKAWRTTGIYAVMALLLPGLFRDQIQMKAILRWLVLAGVVSGLAAIFQSLVVLVFHSNIFYRVESGYAFGVLPRVGGFFAEPMMLAAFLSATISIVLFLDREPFVVVTGTMRRLAIVIMVAAVILSTARSGILTLAAVFLMYFTKANARNKFRWLTFGLVSLVVGTMLGSELGLFDRWESHWGNLVGFLTFRGGVDLLELQDRLMRIQLVQQYASDSFFFGVGLNNVGIVAWRALGKSGPVITDLHNAYATLAVEGGVPIAAAYAVSLALLAYAALRGSRMLPILHGISIALTAVILASLAFTAYLHIFFWLLIGLTLALLNMRERSLDGSA